MSVQGSIASLSTSALRLPESTQLATNVGQRSGPRSLNEIIAAMALGGPYVKSFVVLDEDERIRETFIFDTASLLEEVQSLREAANLLSAAHFGMRVELADGW